MTKVLDILKLAWESIRFIKHYRERQAERERSQSRERALEREHQRLLVEAIASKLVDVVKTNQDGLLQIAKTNAAQAEVFNTWLKSFQPINPDPEPSRVIREEDEWEMEQERLGLPIDQLPPEFRLAFNLEQLERSAAGGKSDPNPHFDREGRDF